MSHKDIVYGALRGFCSRLRLSRAALSLFTIHVSDVRVRVRVQWINGPVSCLLSGVGDRQAVCSPAGTLCPSSHVAGIPSSPALKVP